MQKFRFLFFSCLLAIVYLATAGQGSVKLTTGWDKANHLLAFFTLYILLHFSYEQLSKMQKVLLLFIFAVQIEVVQYFLPNRFFSLLDILADCIGIFFGMVAISLLKMRGIK